MASLLDGLRNLQYHRLVFGSTRTSRRYLFSQLAGSGGEVVAIQRNLGLITIACLHADHVGFLGCGRLTVPAPGGFGSKSIIFGQAHMTGAHAYPLANIRKLVIQRGENKPQDVAVARL